MSKPISRAPRGAKAPVCPEPPTQGQEAFFEEVRATVVLLQRKSAYLTRRFGTPERTAILFLHFLLRDVLRYVEIARRDGRPLDIQHPGGWATSTLVLGEVPAKVIPIGPYLKRQQHG